MTPEQQEFVQGKLEKAMVLLRMAMVTEIALMRDQHLGGVERNIELALGVMRDEYRNSKAL